MAWLIRRRNPLLWGLSLLAFVVGSYIGWSVNANVGAGLWGASAILAFLPFLSHRNYRTDHNQAGDR